MPGPEGSSHIGATTNVSHFRHLDCSFLHWLYAVVWRLFVAACKRSGNSKALAVSQVHFHFHFPPPSNLFAQIIERLDSIMVQQTEAVEAVNALNEALTASEAKIVKIGAETDKLVQSVADLTTIVQNTGQLSPELETALAATADRVAAIQAALQVVDDKVEDGA